MVVNMLCWDVKNDFIAQHNTDTIELSKDKRLALCGAYELLTDSGERVGELYVFVRNGDDTFELSQVVPCPGVLDITWITDVLALTAFADGTACIWKYDQSSLTKQTNLNVSDHVLLACDSIQEKLAFSDSNGCITLWNLTNSTFSNAKLCSWKAHDYEAWCVCFDLWNNELIYSGGDDSRCYLWDSRQGFDRAALSLKHEMGVCSIKNHPIRTHIISTGSYDEQLRIWDLRMQHTGNLCDSTHIPIQTHTVGGGVWRHKWSENGWVLIAAMHAGFVVLGPITLHPASVSLSSSDGLIVSKFRPCAQLAYGVDWSFHFSESADLLNATVATCSFYDKRIGFSRLTIKVHD